MSLVYGFVVALSTNSDTMMRVVTFREWMNNPMNNLRQIFQVLSRKLNWQENTNFMQLEYIMIPAIQCEMSSLLNLQSNIPVNLCGLVMGAVLSISQYLIFIES